MKWEKIGDMNIFQIQSLAVVSKVNWSEMFVWVVDIGHGKFWLMELKVF